MITERKSIFWHNIHDSIVPSNNNVGTRIFANINQDETLAKLLNYDHPVVEVVVVVITFERMQTIFPGNENFRFSSDPELNFFPLCPDRFLNHVLPIEMYFPFNILCFFTALDSHREEIYDIQHFICSVKCVDTTRTDYGDMCQIYFMGEILQNNKMHFHITR